VTGAPSAAVRAAIGCWEFTKGATYLDDRVPPGSAVELDTTTDPREQPPEHYLLRVVPLDSSKARSVRLSGWGISASDDKRVLMFIGDGFSGVTMRLRIRDNLLSGTARGYTDVVPNFSFRHLVRARRVVCPDRPGEQVTLGDSQVSIRRQMKE
jgi:hypothetical protein